MNWNIWLIAIFTSGLLSIVQLYVWPDAGKRLDNRRYIYSFQMNQWLQEVYTEFNLIRNSGTYRDISLVTGRKTITPDYFLKVAEYHYQIKQLLQILKYQGKVTAEVSSDIGFLLEGTDDYNLLTQEQHRKITQNYKSFDILASKHFEIESEISAFEPELQKVIAGIPKDSTADQKFSYEVHKINTLRRLHSEKNLMISYFEDPFEFIDNFNVAAQKILDDYDMLLIKYNKKLKAQEHIKNALLVILAIFSAYLTIAEANKPISVNVDCQRAKSRRFNKMRHPQSPRTKLTLTHTGRSYART